MHAPSRERSGGEGASQPRTVEDEERLSAGRQRQGGGSADDHAGHLATPVVTPYPTRRIADAPNLRVRIRNAMVGAPYEYVFQPSNDKIHSVWFIPAPGATPVHEHTGLKFASDPPRIIGTPDVDGDVTVRVVFERGDGRLLSAESRFYVNKNPRDMWVPIEPADTGDLELKPHRQARREFADRTTDAPGWDLIGASIRGRAHAKDAKYREDHFDLGRDVSSPPWHVVVSCDGAGSASMSRLGSYCIARESTSFLKGELGASGGTNEDLPDDIGRGLNQLLDDVESLDKDKVQQKLEEVFHAMAKEAVGAISLLATEQSRPVKDFNSTVLVAIARHLPNSSKTFVATFQVGDGAIGVGVPSADETLMWKLFGKPDSGQYAGETVFLSQRVLDDKGKFHDRICHELFDAMPVILAMSDGVSDPRFPSEASLHEQGPWRQIWNDILPTLPPEHLPGEADGWETRLYDVLERYDEGHHDDRTIVIARPTPSAKGPAHHG